MEATQDEICAHKRGQECTTMKTDVKFKNINDSYVKFCPGIEKNDEKIWEVTQDEVCVPKKGQKCAKMKTDVKFGKISDPYVKFCPAIEKK